MEISEIGRARTGESLTVCATSALATDPQVRAAVAVCREITRTRAGNFYWGLRLTPEPRRSAMYAIYAWMREADDIVDGPQVSRAAGHALVTAFREQTRQALTGVAESEEPIWRALAAVAREYPISASDFYEMLDGQIADLDPRRLQSWDELRHYCCQVAGTVGSVCVSIWGQTDPQASDLAVERGIAFQLTNILRDVGEDLKSNRVYLPESEFARFAITPEELALWSRPRGCEALMRSVITTAREHFVRSEPLEQMIDPACRATLWAMTEIYRQLLETIARDPAQVTRRRVRLSTPRKMWIALRARTLGGNS